MLDRELLVLVFAPATVGLVVTAVRRAPPTVYWASLVGVIALALLGLGQGFNEGDSPVVGSLVFGIIFVAIPTIATFGVGRSIKLTRGGAYVFAVSCTAYLLVLGVAAGIGIVSRVIAL